MLGNYFIKDLNTKSSFDKVTLSRSLRIWIVKSCLTFLYFNQCYVLEFKMCPTSSYISVTLYVLTKPIPFTASVHKNSELNNIYTCLELS